MYKVKKRNKKNGKNNAIYKTVRMKTKEKNPIGQESYRPMNSPNPYDTSVILFYIIFFIQYAWGLLQIGKETEFGELKETEAYKKGKKMKLPERKKKKNNITNT